LNRLLWGVMIVVLAVLVWRTRDTIEAIYAGVGSLTNTGVLRPSHNAHAVQV
jgi:hypothetical protein